MIEIVNMTKKFDERPLFENLNMVINDGEFVVFSGVSGCGKTTLLNIIGGIEKIDGGKVLIDGQDISDRKNKLAFYRYKVGFLFQNYALVENKTVRENLKLIKNKCRTEMSIEDALKQVSLLNKIDEKVYKLSGGEQQRIALARLMLKRCNIILADEPTGSLDLQNADMVMDMLKKINKQGKTVVMVTHDKHYMDIGDRNVKLEISN